MTKTIQLGEISIVVTKKAIKNVHLSVHPPDGRVTLVAPIATRFDVARAYAISKLGWIREQQKTLKTQARDPLQFKSGPISGTAVERGAGLRFVALCITERAEPRNQSAVCSEKCQYNASFTESHLTESIMKYLRLSLLLFCMTEYASAFVVAQSAENKASSAFQAAAEYSRDAKGVAVLGKGKQRCYVIPSLGLVIVRLGDSVGREFDDSEFLAKILAEETALAK